jgi:hypothetical protein
MFSGEVFPYNFSCLRSRGLSIVFLIESGKVFVLA